MNLIAKAKVAKGKLQNLAYKLKMRLNWFDIGRHLDTSDCVDKELLYDSIDSPNKEFMGRYVPTNLKQLKPLLEKLLAFDKTLLDSTLVDFGCGKGRVLIMAKEMGFRKVVGVEFSRKLYDTCLENLKKTRSQAQVFCMDAVDFPISADIRIFYFCNPFEYCITEKVLKNIKNCRSSANRYLVHIDPRAFGRLDAAGYELLVEHHGPGTPYHLYKVL
jgi:SAM-dependent methyltransferase